MKQYKLIMVMLMAALTTGRSLAQESFSAQAANMYVHNKDWNGLVQYAIKWTSSNPRAEIAWYYLGNAYGIGLNDPANAARAFEKAVAIKPQWPEAWNALGFNYLDLKRYDSAVAAFQRCIELAPSKSNYWHNLAYAYAEANKPAQAVSTLEKQRSSVESSATGVDWYNMGNDFAALGRPNDAITAYQKALQINSQYGPAWNNLGVVEFQRGNLNNALQAFRRAASLGEASGRENAAMLEANLATQAQPQQSGGRARNFLEEARNFQAKGWETNHPGHLERNPFGTPH
jgi:tetratricopeptide (TPR) repeat protein